LIGDDRGIKSFRETGLKDGITRGEKMFCHSSGKITGVK